MSWTGLSLRGKRPIRIGSSYLPVRFHSLSATQCELTWTGFQSKELIVKAGLTAGEVDQYPELDVTIDGADE